MKNNNSYVLNYHQIKKIIKNYYSLQGRKVKITITDKITSDHVLKPCVHAVVSVSEKDYFAGIKQESTKILSTEELKEIISNILEKEGKELISLNSDVSFKAVCSDPWYFRYHSFNSTYLENKTFTITTKEKILSDSHSTVVKPSEEEMNNQELTLLSEGQIWGNKTENQLEVLRKYGTKAAISDLCVLTGSYLAETYYNVSDSSLDSSKRRTSWFWTKSDDGDNDVRAVSMTGYMNNRFRYDRYAIVRPALQSSTIIYTQISPNKVRGYNDTYEVEYGEYPQYAADYKMQNVLESEFQRGLNPTGRNYTFDSVKYNDYDTGIREVTYDEYEYQGKKYIRVKANFAFNESVFELSNGKSYRDGDFVWVEVSPVKWLIDDRTRTLVSKIGLVSGIRYLDKETQYKGDFSKTEMKAYLDKHMSKDLFQSAVLTRVQDMPPEKEIVKGLEDGLNINDEIGTELDQRTSEHIPEEFAVEENKLHGIGSIELVFGGFKQKYTDEYYEEINKKNKVKTRKLTKSDFHSFNSFNSTNRK